MVRGVYSEKKIVKWKFYENFGNQSKKLELGVVVSGSSNLENLYLLLT